MLAVLKTENYKNIFNELVAIPLYAVEFEWVNKFPRENVDESVKESFFKLLDRSRFFAKIGEEYLAVIEYNQVSYIAAFDEFGNIRVLSDNVCFWLYSYFETYASLDEFELFKTRLENELVEQFDYPNIVKITRYESISFDLS